MVKLIPTGLILTLVGCAVRPAAVEDLFADGEQQWSERSFAGHTQYQWSHEAQSKVVCSDSDSAASALVRKVEVDLDKTPILHWRWRVDKSIHPEDERSPAGDDFAARIYVVYAPGASAFTSRAINYVWSAQESIGASWPNPYSAGRSMMVSVRGAADSTGVWYRESRNVREDFQRLAGKQVNTVHVLAVMSDTDNTWQQASACFADIYFSPE